VLIETFRSLENGGASYVFGKLSLPSDNGGLLDGNQFFSIMIGHTPTIRWRLIFLVVEGVAGLCYHFGKNKIKFKLHFPFKATQNFLSPSNGVGVLDGD
jgi:hypothetical protein